ncbi:unnamed protein product [Mytilus coruscus]|uniref:C-type lectin domain-containing protein n=1 Tax=Mytilus coruscus TaxID=42192 RepID=A0A6J8CC58_MYTCO|nr:unnamed protein product [Mytilus coruscus]
MKFADSKALCENLNAQMIMPKTVEENNILSEIGSNFWIGLTDYGKNLDWTWNDDSKLGLEFFVEDEPNNELDPEECVIYLTSGWHDVPCQLGLTIACQKKPDITAMENERVDLTCVVKYTQNISKLFWTRSVDDISVAVSEYAIGGNITSPSLVFEHVKWSDEGTYKCHVTTISGLRQTVSMRLFVNATNMRPCRCEYRRTLEYWSSKIIQNRTREELMKELEPKLQMIKKELEVNKTQLSASMRKRTSAPDKRKSSETMGLAGATFIFIVVGLMILNDILTIVKHVKSAVTVWNSKKMEKQKIKDIKTKMKPKPCANKLKNEIAESYA